MKLLYITSYSFPSKRAEPYYVKSMAGGFKARLGTDFQLVIRGDVTDEIRHLKPISVMMPSRLRTLRYFFWFPFFVFRNGFAMKETIFMSHDPYLILIFIFWKKVLWQPYSVASDWHQLFDDWKDKLIARNSDFLITTTNRLKGFIVSRCGVTPEKICVAYGGVDEGLFLAKRKIGKPELRKALMLSEDAFLIGYVGGFKSVGLEKGLGTMVRALPYLDPKIRMVFVGGYVPDIEEYEKLAESLGVKEKCIFVLKQPFEKVVEYEVALDVLVIPYPDQHHFRDYGFPMKVWEYMAAGNPIVYSNLEIIGEALEGRATPFIPDDPKDLARVLNLVSARHGKTDTVAQKNATEVSSYTWNARTARIVDFIGGGTR